VIASYLGFAQKDPGRIGGKNYFSRKGAKTQKNLRKRGSALRLCAFAREMSSAKNTFCAKPLFSLRSDTATPA